MNGKTYFSSLRMIKQSCVARLVLARVIQQEIGWSKALVVLIPWYSVQNKFLVTGLNAHQTLIDSLHNQSLNMISLTTHPLLLSTKQTLGQAHCSYQRNEASVQRSCTTTSKPTHKYLYSFSQLHPFVLHHGTYIPCSCTEASMLTSRIGGKNISSSIPRGT